MTQPEHQVQSAIRVALSANQCTVFRVNAGQVRLPDGRFFQTGVPKGHPDLYGFRWSDHQVFYVEVKTKTGRPRPDGIARTPEDAIKIVEEGLIGYGF